MRHGAWQVGHRHHLTPVQHQASPLHAAVSVVGPEAGSPLWSVGGYHGVSQIGHRIGRRPDPLPYPGLGRLVGR